MKWSEWLMLLVFGLVAILWMTSKLHGIDYAAVALLGISVLLITGVLDWEDLISEKAAWGVFIWYGGLIRMAEALGQTGITKRFAEASASLTTGWKWWLALASLLLIYFYAHYVFASITAHVTAMFVPFLIVILAAGTPPYLAVLSLGLLFQSRRITHSLRHNARADLLRRRLYNATNLVVAWTDYFFDNDHCLEFSRFHLVESSRTLVERTNMAGYSSTPLAKKLGIKEGSRIALVNAPKDFQAELGELPDKVEFVKRLDEFARHHSLLCFD